MIFRNPVEVRTGYIPDTSLWC